MGKLVDLLEAYPIKERPPYTLYCDMDGVLTDFASRFEHFSGMCPDEYEQTYGPARMWNIIDQQVGLKFWADMPWMERGKELWEFISYYNPTLLTSPSQDNVSRLGKNLWVRNHINPPPPVIFAYSSDKQRYATPTSILIDDKKSNIKEWQEAGGIAIRCVYNQIDPVICQLKELGYE